VQAWFAFLGKLVQIRASCYGLLLPIAVHFEHQKLVPEAIA